MRCIKNSVLCSIIAILLQAYASAQFVPKWDVVRPTSYSSFGSYDAFGTMNYLASSDGTHIYMFDKSSGFNTIQYTADGGTNWTPFNIDAVWVPKDKNTRYTIQNISSAAPLCVCVGGHESLYIPGGSQSGKFTRSGGLLYTTDAGATWKQQSFDTNTRVSAVCMIDSIRGYAFLTMTGSDNFPDGYKRTGQLCYTDNAWNTYTTVRVPDSTLYATKMIAKSKNEIVFLGYRLSASNRMLFSSTDAGTTWTLTETNISNPYLLSKDAIYNVYSDRLSYSAPGANYVEKSTDGAKSWQRLSTIISEGSTGLIACAFADEQHGVAYGLYQGLYLSSDYGTSWEKQQTDIPFCYTGYIKEAIFPRTDAAVVAMNDHALVVYRGKQRLKRPEFVSPDLNDRRRKPRSTIDLTWTPIAGAKAYQLQVIERNIKTSNTWDEHYFDNPSRDTMLFDTSCVLKNLEYFFHYDLRLRALNEKDTSVWNRLSCEQILTTQRDSADLMPPRIVYPKNGTLTVPTTTTYTWDAVPGALSYELQLAFNQDSLNKGILVVDAKNILTNSYPLSLQSNRVYAARVRAVMSDTLGAWSDQFNQHLIRTGDVGAGVKRPDPAELNTILRVSPNPVRTEARVELLDEKLRYLDPECRVVNALGQEVIGWTASQSFQTNALPNGSYVLHCRINREEYALPFVILHD